MSDDTDGYADLRKRMAPVDAKFKLLQERFAAVEAKYVEQFIKGDGHHGGGLSKLMKRKKRI